jgi:excisionase family DNA binding protein
MSYRAAATYSGLSPMSLRRLVAAGRLRVYRPVGRKALMDRAELDRLIEASGAGTEAKAM